MSVDIKVSVSVGLIAAIIAGELVSFVWYSDNTPWGRRQGERHFLAAILADVGLAVIIQWITGNKWSVHRWEDAAVLAAAIALVYACLEAPHAVRCSRSLSRFFFHTLHKFVITFAMAATMWFLKEYDF